MYNCGTDKAVMIMESQLQLNEECLELLGKFRMSRFFSKESSGIDQNSLIKQNRAVVILHRGGKTS